MATKFINETDAAIRAAMIARGWHDVSITPQTVRSSGHDAGDWLILSAQFRPDTTWQVVGRRRSRKELIEMIEGRSAKSLRRWS